MEEKKLIYAIPELVNLNVPQNVVTGLSGENDNIVGDGFQSSVNESAVNTDDNGEI